MSAVPILEEELDRKGLETIEWLIHQHDIAKINAAQLSTGIDALFMALNGLVKEDLNDIITLASNDLPRQPPTMRYAYIKGRMTVSLTWIVGRDKYHIAVYDTGERKLDKAMEFDTPKEALHSLSVRRLKLQKDGYKLI